MNGPLADEKENDTLEGMGAWDVVVCEDNMTSASNFPMDCEQV